MRSGWVLAVALAACGGERGDDDGGDELVEMDVEECSSDDVRAMLECEGVGVAFEGCYGIAEACQRLIPSGFSPACVPSNDVADECEELARVGDILLHCNPDAPDTRWPTDPTSYTCEEMP